MTLPSISIVTPSLNQGGFLGEALESVRCQSLAVCEHLVLDGGSGDNTVDLLQSFAATSPSLWWRSSPDSGQSAALNEGFRRASGDIIGWLNADDRYRAGCFEAVAEAFAQHPEIDILYGDYTFIDSVGNHIGLRREIEFSRFILRYHKVLYIPTAATFFRRRLFDEGYFLSNSLHYAMDVEFFLRLDAAGYRFFHLAQVLADFRIHPAAKSTQFVDRQQAEHRQVVLQTTPLSRRFRSMWARNAAANALQIPAALLRYTEKLLRGFYLPSGNQFARLQSPNAKGNRR
jgi:glycosyltransferase involved in cell wall biosynthesis